MDILYIYIYNDDTVTAYRRHIDNDVCIYIYIRYIYIYNVISSTKKLRFRFGQILNSQLTVAFWHETQHSIRAVSGALLSISRLEEVL